MFKNRFMTLTKKEKMHDQSGLGLPQKDINNDNVTKPATSKQLFGKMATRHHNREALTGLKTGSTNDIIKSTISLKESAFARIEQLLQESKSFLLEAYTKRISDGGITPGGSSPLGGGKGVQVDNKLKVTTSDINRNISNKISADLKSRDTAIDNARAVKPQITTKGETIGMTQAATNMNASARQNTDQRQQEKWETQQSQAQG